MRVNLAKTDDLYALYDFYSEVIDHQPYDAYGAGWTKDVYPSITVLKENIENDLFFMGIENEKIICAAAVSLHEEEDYKKGKWIRKLKDDEIAVLHLFAVHPDYRGKGYAQKILKEIISECEQYVMAIHLDVVKGNLPAMKTYEKAGFIHVDEIEMFYVDTGKVTVELLEYDYKTA